MRARLRRFAIIFATALALGGLGFASGSAIDSALAQSPPLYESCTQDECEGGSLCTTNAGYSTQCDRETDGGCHTEAC